MNKRKLMADMVSKTKWRLGILEAVDRHHSEAARSKTIVKNVAKYHVRIATES
jgi:hypothetical protein